MKSLTIYPSTSKLAKKFLLPIVAVIGAYIFIIVPDDVIGVGTSFFTFITFTLLLMCIGLGITYLYQLNISKKSSILYINEEYAHFRRNNLKVNFSPEIVFTALESDLESPPSDIDDMDFLIDKKENYLFIWKKKRKVAKIRATLMNLDSMMLATLLNDINNVEKINRAKIIESFHTLITKKANQSLKGQILFREE